MKFSTTFVVSTLAVCLCAPVFCQEGDTQAAKPPAESQPVVAGANDSTSKDSTQTEQLEPLPDWRIRGRELGKQLVGIQAFVETVPGTASDHARNFPKEWTRSFSGLGRRFASQYGQFLVSETVEFGVSALHHEDPRYFRMPEASIKRRIGHSIASIWVARRSDGPGNTIALSRIAGVYGSWWVAQHWEPQSATGVGQFMLWGTVGMFTKGFANAFHEFWPDAKRKFFTRH